MLSDIDFTISILERRSTHILGVLVQAGLDELFEGLRVAAGELRWVVLRYKKEDSHRMEFRVRGLPFGELDGRDAQRPDVRFAVVARLLYHLRRHPERCTDKRVPLARRIRQLSRHTYISGGRDFVY